MPSSHSTYHSLFLALLLSALIALPRSACAVAPDAIVANGSFEASDGQWPTGWGRPDAGGTYEQENGNHFVRLVATQPNRLTMLYQRFRLPTGCKALELDWKEHVTGLKRGSQSWYDVRLLVQFLDAANKEMSTKPDPAATGQDTNGWRSRKMEFIVPDGAATVVLMPTLFQVAAGTLDLDDIELKSLNPQALIDAAQAKRAEETTKEAQTAATVRAAFKPRETLQPAKAPKELHVSGRQVLTSDSREIWLQGVNAGGLETLPADQHPIQSVIVGIDDWKANIIRLPVSSTMWVGRGEWQERDGGEGYRLLIDEAVTLASNRGAYLLIDLHNFRAPQPEDIDFWKSAAARYKNNPAVLFDLFNEPHDVSWNIWRDGGTVGEKPKGTVDESAFLSQSEQDKTNAGYHSVGMQALLNAVRSTGAKNICVVGGLAWSGDLSGITRGYALEDKTGNGIIYGWHNYNWHKDWQHRVLDAAAKYPILVGEVGCDIKKMGFIPEQDQEDPYTWFPDMLGFIQKYHLHWTAWCLHPQATPILISDWNYTPTPFWGVPVKAALAGKQFEMKRMR